MPKIIFKQKGSHNNTKKGQTELIFKIRRTQNNKTISILYNNGIYVQSLLESCSEKDQMGLSRDNGRITLGNINNQKSNKMRKLIISIFKSIFMQTVQKTK